MFNLSLTVAGLYLEIVLYTLAMIIVLSVLIIELASWFSSMKAKQVASNVITYKLEMSIATKQTPTSSAASPNTQKADKADPKQESSAVSMITSASADANPSIGSIKIQLDRILPICVYINYLLCLTAQFFGRFAVGINHDCDYTTIGGFFYMAAKCCLYLVLLYRLYKVYSGTIFQKGASIKKLKIAAVFTVICALAIAIANVVTIKKVIVTIEGNKYCGNIAHTLIFILLVVYDLIMNIGCCYAFSRPLLWLTEMKKGSQQSNKIYSTVVRYTVLTFVTVTSTFLVMFVAVLLQMNDIAFIDMPINSVCVMFFNRGYTRFYYCLCCGAHKLGHKIIQRNCCCATQTPDAKDANDEKKKEDQTAV